MTIRLKAFNYDMKTKTKPETPAPKTVSTAAPVENNKPALTLASLEEAFEQLYKSAFGVLVEIRDRQLWSPDWTTFREYGEKRWRSRVRELVPDGLAPFRAVIGPDRNAPKAAKVKAPKAAKAPAVQSDPEPDPNHLPKGKTLVEVFAAEIKPAAEPPKKAKKPTQFQRTLKAMEKAGAVPKPGTYRAAEQVKAKVESLGQLRNRARMAKGETKIRLVAQIAREHGPAAAADLVPGLATEVPGVNNLPAVGVIG